MTFNPISRVVDAPLAVSGETVHKLTQLRTAPRFPELPGTDTRAEKERLSAVLDLLFDRLIVGIQAHPTKLWVMQQFQPALEAVEMEDTEAREHFATHLHSIMDVLGIESSDGVLGFYL